MTSLTVYLSNVATTTLTTAASLASAAGGTIAGDSSLIGTSTGYGELYGLGNAGAWAAAGSIGSPSGNGWLWDVTTLVGQTIAAGTWSPTLRVRVSSGTATITWNVRYYKRSSGGTYTSIGTVTQTGVAMTTGYQTLTPTASLGSMSFATGDKLYMDVWPNITSNSTGSGSAVLFITVTTSATQGDATGSQGTPGYATTTVAESATLAGVGTLAATLTITAKLSKTIAVVGTITATLTRTAKLSKTIAGTGTFTATPRYSLTAVLHGVGTISSTPKYTWKPTPTIHGAATLIAALSYKIPLSKTVAGTGTFSATPTRGIHLAKTLTAVGTFTATPRYSIRATFSGSSTLAATMTQAWKPSVMISGRGTLLARFPVFLSLTAAGRTSFIGRPVAGGLGLVANVNSLPLFIIAGTLQIQNAIARRSTCSFQAYTDMNTHFQQNQAVYIYNNGVLLFSGYVSQPQETKVGYQPSLLQSIQCVDQHYLADKRIVAASYYNSSPGAIARQILNTYLLAEGVTEGQIVDTGVFPSESLYPGESLYPMSSMQQYPLIQFNYVPVSTALDSLAALANDNGIPFYWQIDQNKALYFAPYMTYISSNVIDGTTVEQKQNPITVNRQNPLYRNTQYILGGTAQTVLQNENKKGDGVATSWSMGYDLSSAPTIKVNGATKKVGLKGVTTGQDFYWQKGDATIEQDSQGTVLQTTDTLNVIYYGQYDAVTVSQDLSLVSQEITIEGSTSGVVESVATDPNITTNQQGFTEASNYISRYGQQGIQLNFYTMQQGYVQGYSALVNLPAFALVGVYMLIESVTITDSVDNHNLWYNVSAIIGPYDTTWVSFFANLIQASQAQAASSVQLNQTLNLLVSSSINLNIAANATVTVDTPPLPGPTLYPSETLTP